MNARLKVSQPTLAEHDAQDLPPAVGSCDSEYTDNNLELKLQCDHHN